MPERIGPSFIAPNLVEFRVFAPKAKTLTLQLDHSSHAMHPAEKSGFFSIRTEAAAGMRYGFQIDDGPSYPDPASRFQPDGVHKKSELIDLSGIERSCTNWKGIEGSDLIIYELHLGTFTDDGTALAAIERLDELVDLGITALELLPVAQAAGNWNWGYDGVNLFAPANAYGRPEDLIALIDAAHRRGIAVILDVVYNHFGPEGNYLFAYGGYLSKKHSTPWGDAPNYDGRKAGPLREFILENVRYWIEDFGFDGLRVDATHFIKDTSSPHIVSEIGARVRALETRLGRPLHLIGETNVYDPELITGLEEGGSAFDSLWCDEFLHSHFAQLKPGEHMASREYRPGSDLSLILSRGYAFHGTLTSPPGRHCPNKFPGTVAREPLVASIQNHDFIGNHPAGLRLHQITSHPAHHAAAALLILMPSTPMLFMGEEFACDSPFYFFVDFEDTHLRRAVERGRESDHPQHNWEAGPSPTSPDAFLKSKIGAANNGNQETLSWYKDLITLRKEWRKTGILTSEALRAEWDDEKQLVHLIFAENGDERFLIVRLHPVNTVAGAVPLTVEGEISLSQNITTVAAEAGNLQIAAKPFAVIAGTGRAKIG